MSRQIPWISSFTKSLCSSKPQALIKWVIFILILVGINIMMDLRQHGVLVPYDDDTGLFDQKNPKPRNSLPHENSKPVIIDKIQSAILVDQINPDPVDSLIPKDWKPATIDEIPSPIVHQVSCAKVFAGDEKEIETANSIEKSVPKEGFHTPINITDCATFLKERKYIRKPLTEEEKNYPIAYSIMLYKDPDQLELLLRAIYMPQNYYCLHVDSKASTSVRGAIQSIADCLPNVFLSSRSVSVVWGLFTVVEGDLICMEDLLKYKKWKYFINLTGQEFPLKTNWELVKIMKSVKGANLISGTISAKNSIRTKWKFIGLTFQNRLLAPPPYGMQLSKGPVHIIASRGFVNFTIYNPISVEFRDWVQDTCIPDETYFSSLNYNPQLGVPGSYKGKTEISEITPHLPRWKLWAIKSAPKCHGKYQRGICLFTAGDLQLMHTNTKLFANKFHMYQNPITLQCLEELMFNKTRLEVQGQRVYNGSYYEQLGFTLNHVPSD